MIRFTIDICGSTVILTAEQLETITAALGADPLELVNTKWVGAGKGENGGDYTTSIASKKISEVLKASVLPAPEYNALRFFTAHKSA